MTNTAYISQKMRNGAFTVHTSRCATVRGSAAVDEIPPSEALDHITMPAPTYYRHCQRCAKLEKISDIRARVEREAQAAPKPAPAPAPEYPAVRRVVITGDARYALNLVITQSLFANLATGELYLKRSDEWIKVSGLGADPLYGHLSAGVMALWLHNVLTLIETPQSDSLRRLCLSGPIEAVTN